MSAQHGRLLVWTGSAVLLVTAIFHGSGYGSIIEAAQTPEIDPLIASVLRPLWLFPSLHWVMLAALAILAVAHPSRLSRYVLLVCALVVGFDAGLLLVFLGPFVGEAMLAAAALLFVAGSLLTDGPPD